MVSQFSAQALVPRVLRQYSRGTSLSVCVRSCTAGIASAALELHPDQVEQWGGCEDLRVSGGEVRVVATKSPRRRRRRLALKGIMLP